MQKASPALRRARLALSDEIERREASERALESAQAKADRAESAYSEGWEHGFAKRGEVADRNLAVWRARALAAEALAVSKPMAAPSDEAVWRPLLAN